MESWIDSLKEAFLAQSALEVAAVVTGVLYLILAAREKLACWYFAAVSTMLYLIILTDIKLYAEAALQIYYLLMAGYGWYTWKYGSGKADGESQIISGSLLFHVLAVLGILSLTAGVGTLMGEYSDAQMPYIDAFTTVGALVTTWMVTKKYLENWIYWFFIDAVAIYMYWTKGLYLTAILFLFYTGMVVYGFVEWRSHFRNQLEHE